MITFIVIGNQNKVFFYKAFVSIKKVYRFFCGEAGSIHDARLLKRSSIYQKATNGYLGTDVLLGDSAYPSNNWLIPPFRDNGQLTRNQKLFNYKHSATSTFGLLKGRFRRLKYFENENIQFIVECVVAAGLLHNLCIGFNDEIESQCDEQNETELLGPNCLSQNYTKRDEIFQSMFNN